MHKIEKSTRRRSISFVRLVFLFFLSQIFLSLQITNEGIKVNMDFSGAERAVRGVGGMYRRQEITDVLATGAVE